MTDALTMAQEVFLDKINPICKRFGLNHIMAKLYTILYFADKPLSLDDMTKRLNISKGSASTNIRALERYGAVRRAWVRGSRKDYYDVERDISKLLKDRVRAMAEERFSEIDNMITSAFDVLNTLDPDNKDEQESIEKFKEKLEDIKSIYVQAKSLIDLFNTDIVDKIFPNKPPKSKKEEAVYNGNINNI